MSNPQPVAVLPDHDTIMRRLLAIDDDHHIVSGLYPHLAKLANREQTGLGVVLALHLAVADYTAGMAPLMAVVVLQRAEDFTRALLVDSPILDDAIEALRDLGLIPAA